MNEIAKKRLMPKLLRCEVVLNNSRSRDLLYRCALNMLIETQWLICDGLLTNEDEVKKLKLHINALMDFASPGDPF